MKRILSELRAVLLHNSVAKDNAATKVLFVLQVNVFLKVPLLVQFQEA
jgi:hypothetical protein